MSKNKKKNTFFKKTDIFIYSSELACLINCNKFKSPSHVLYRLWNTYFKEDFNTINNSIEEIDKYLIEDTDDIIDNICQKYNNKKITKNLQKCKNTQNIEDMKAKRNEILEECKKMTLEDKRKIEKSIFEVTNTNFGTKNEEKTLHIYTRIRNIPVITLKQFFRKLIFKKDNYNWYIGGKIDGLTKNDDGSKTIIEVKNRMYKLFYQLRDYEKIQIFSYMFILETALAEIVEIYNKEQPEVNIISIPFEFEYWENILDKILLFINYFNTFMENINLRKQLIIEGPDKFKIDIYNIK